MELVDVVVMEELVEWEVMGGLPVMKSVAVVVGGTVEMAVEEAMVVAVVVD